ncbi:hypothetical protein F2P56_012566, partial [Juglans regia]
NTIYKIMKFSQTQVWGVLLLLSFLFSSFQPLFSHPTNDTNSLHHHGLNRKMLSLSPEVKSFNFYSPPPPSTVAANMISSPSKPFYFYSPPPPSTVAANMISSPSKPFYFYSPPPPNQPQV